MQIARRNKSSGGRSTNKKVPDAEKSRQNKNDFPKSADEKEEDALHSMISGIVFVWL